MFSFRLHRLAAVLLFWVLAVSLWAACRPAAPAAVFPTVAGYTATAPTPEPSAAPAATPPAPPSPMPSPQVDKWALWTEGTRLRGANIYQRRVFPPLDGTEFLGPGPLGPPYTQADFDALAAQGVNWVNFSVPGLFTVSPPYRPDPQVVRTIDRLLQMAARARLYVVLSARTGPGRSEFSILREGAGDWFPKSYLIETVWQDPAARRAWAAMWRYTAQRYAHNPVVVGYDLMVEPNANDIVGVWAPDEFVARYRNTGYDWTSWYPQIVAAIREVDPHTPILVGCMGYSAVDWLPTMKPVDDPRVVYTVHQYQPDAYTHQEPEDHLPYPGRWVVEESAAPEFFGRSRLAALLQPIADFRARYHVPIAVNETGVKRWAPGADAFMRDQMAEMERLGVNYAVWMWYPAWPPLAAGDHAFNFRLGADPAHRQDTPNALWAVYRAFWARNRLRPATLQP